MPILSEKSERSRRGSPRRWLAGCGVLVALLLLLPLVPFATRVTLHVGDRWLGVYTLWDSVGAQPLLVGGIDGNVWSWWTRSDRALAHPVTTAALSRRHFTGSTEDFHACWVTFGRLIYWIEWYRLPADAPIP